MNLHYRGWKLPEPEYICYVADSLIRLAQSSSCTRVHYRRGGEFEYAFGPERQGRHMGCTGFACICKHNIMKQRM